MYMTYRHRPAGGLLGSIESLTGLSKNQILSGIHPDSRERALNASTTGGEHNQFIRLMNGSLTTSRSLRESARKARGPFTLHRQRFPASEMVIKKEATIEKPVVRVPAGVDYYPKSGLVLYLAEGVDSYNRRVFYVGVTKNGVAQRHREHLKNQGDRIFDFTVHHYYCWELPEHWLYRPHRGEVAMAEMLTLYTTAATLRERPDLFWLDNRHYVGKIHGMALDDSVTEVVNFLKDNVYPVLEEIYGMPLDVEPNPGEYDPINDGRLYARGASRFKGGWNMMRHLAMQAGWNVK